MMLPIPAEGRLLAMRGLEEAAEAHEEARKRQDPAGPPLPSAPSSPVRGRPYRPPRAVLDPVLGLGSVLFSLSELEEEMADTLDLEMAWRKVRVGKMHGKTRAWSGSESAAAVRPRRRRSSSVS